MKKLFKENMAVFLSSVGIFGAVLIIGLVILYGLEKSF